MKKLNKVAMLFATAAMATAAGAQTVDNWRAADGTVWKNGTNELCWRNAGWTPATAAAGCDGAIVPVAAPAPAPAAAPAPAPAPDPSPLAPLAAEAVSVLNALANACFHASTSAARDASSVNALVLKFTSVATVQ